MTFTVSLCSYKGGTGKTTLAYNLSERSASSGLETVLVDFDPQEGSVGVAALRKDDTAFSVRSGQVSHAGADDWETFRQHSGADLIVCDMPGWDNIAVTRFLSLSDLVLSPIGAGPMDLLAAANFQWMAGRMGLNAFYVPNILPAGKARREKLIGELEGLSPPGLCAPVFLYRRVAHTDAMRRGLAVCEFAPHSRAASEVDSLWCWVKTRLEL